MTTIDAGGLAVALSCAASAYVNGLAPDLPPLYWTLQDHVEPPRLCGLADDGDESALAQWAARFGLEPTARSRPGARFFGNMVETTYSHRPYKMRVWCIVDRAAWEQAAAQGQAAYQETAHRIASTA